MFGKLWPHEQYQNCYCMLVICLIPCDQNQNTKAPISGVNYVGIITVNFNFKDKTITNVDRCWDGFA